MFIIRNTGKTPALNIHSHSEKLGTSTMVTNGEGWADTDIITLHVDGDHDGAPISSDL